MSVEVVEREEKHECGRIDSCANTFVWVSHTFFTTSFFFDLSGVLSSCLSSWISPKHKREKQASERARKKVVRRRSPAQIHGREQREGKEGRATSWRCKCGTSVCVYYFSLLLSSSLFFFSSLFFSLLVFSCELTFLSFRLEVFLCGRHGGLTSLKEHVPSKSCSGFRLEGKRKGELALALGLSAVTRVAAVVVRLLFVSLSFSLSLSLSLLLRFLSRKT